MDRKDGKVWTDGGKEARTLNGRDGYSTAIVLAIAAVMVEWMDG